MRNVTNMGEARATMARGIDRAGTHKPYMDHHVKSSPKSAINEIRNAETTRMEVQI